MHMMIGGSNAGTELQKFESQRDRAQPISVSEYQQRLSKLRELMRESAVDCVYLDATSSLYYFTGLRCHRSERLHGALITGDALIYVCPAFEEEKTRAALLIESDFLLWQEHESPTALIVRSL
ncbi:MAG: aminopeptidase P family N-terminal domain-containing protein, partial [Pseudomonadota bacterium]